jgi:hypothetical protein
VGVGGGEEEDDAAVTELGNWDGLNATSFGIDDAC